MDDVELITFERHDRRVRTAGSLAEAEQSGKVASALGARRSRAGLAQDANTAAWLTEIRSALLVAPQSGQCGPYEDQEAAEKEELALAAKIDGLDDEGLGRFITERGLPPTRH